MINCLKNIAKLRRSHPYLMSFNNEYHHSHNYTIEKYFLLLSMLQQRVEILFLLKLKSIHWSLNMHVTFDLYTLDRRCTRRLSDQIQWSNKVNNLLSHTKQGILSESSPVNRRSCLSTEAVCAKLRNSVTPLCSMQQPTKNVKTMRSS